MVQTFRIGIMKISLHEMVTSDLDEIVDVAAEEIRDHLTDQLDLDIDISVFTGPQLLARSSRSSPLELLQVGLSEKANRNIHFMLVVFEADLVTTERTSRVFLPSKLMNIGLISTKRLTPKFWGHADNQELVSKRLSTLMLHTLGHILELKHTDDRDNLMYHLQSIDDLDHLEDFTAHQLELIAEMIPIEAHEEVSNSNNPAFIFKHIFSNLRIIYETVTEAKPLALIFRMSTVITAALSVIIILFFTAEIWDIAGALQFAPLVIFSVIALASSTGVFYNSFKVGSNHRQNKLGESRVVIIASTIITLLLVNMLLYLIFFSLSLMSALLMFPEELKITWSTADPANTLIAQIKLGMFLATMGVLTGSLGGRADSEAIIHDVLFYDVHL